MVAVITYPLKAANTKFTSPEGLPMKLPVWALLAVADAPHGRMVYSQPSSVGKWVGLSEGLWVGDSEGGGVGTYDGRRVGQAVGR